MVIEQHILDKLINQTDIKWREASNDLGTGKVMLVSVALDPAQASDVLKRLHSGLKSTLVSISETPKKVSIQFGYDKLQDILARNEYISVGGFKPLLYTLNAKQQYGHHEFPFQGNLYSHLGADIDFADPSTPYKFVCLVANADVENLYIDKESPLIENLLRDIEIKSMGKSIEEILVIVNTTIDSLTTNHVSVIGKTRQQVEEGLNRRLESYVKSKIPINTGVVWPRPKAEIHIDELIKEGVLVCAQKGILAAIVVGSLIKSNLLPQGSARQYRSLIHREDGSIRGAHAWAVYHDITTDNMWILDPRWLHVKLLDAEKPETIGYGIPAVREMRKRLETLDRSKIEKWFEGAIQSASSFKELTELFKMGSEKYQLFNFGSSSFDQAYLSAIQKNLNDYADDKILLQRVAESGIHEIGARFFKALVEHVGRYSKNQAFRARLEREGGAIITNTLLPLPYGIQNCFLVLAQESVNESLWTQLKKDIALLVEGAPINMLEKRVTPFLVKFEHISKLPFSEGNSKELMNKALSELTSGALSMNSGGLLLNVDKKVKETFELQERLQLAALSDRVSNSFEIDNKDGDTLIHYIARHNRIDLWAALRKLELFQEKDLEFTGLALNQAGKSPLHVAMDLGHYELCAQMLDVCPHGQAPTLLADILRWNKNHQKIDIIKSHMPEKKLASFEQIVRVALRYHMESLSGSRSRNPFLEVVCSKDPKKVYDFLLSNSGYTAPNWHVTTSTADSHGNTPFHEIAKMKDTTAALAMIEVLVRLKIRKTFSLNDYTCEELVNLEAKNKNQQTPFERALERGHFQIARALIQLYPPERHQELENQILKQETKHALVLPASEAIQERPTQLEPESRSSARRKHL